LLSIAQTERAILLARAMATTKRGFSASIRASHDPLAAPLRTARLTTVVAPMIKSRRMSCCPIFDVRPSASQNMSYQAEKDSLIAELEQAKLNSDEARRRAEGANLAKSRFLATMNHELRTPFITSENPRTARQGAGRIALRGIPPQFDSAWAPK
jgi:signal transduction histidine kinase